MCVSSEKASQNSKDALCPITAISFVHESDVTDLTPDNEELIRFHDGYLRVKKQPLNAPLTSFKISYQKPCIDRMIVPEAVTFFYPLQISKHRTCPINPEFNESEDNRYTAIYGANGFKLTEYSIMQSNNVTDKLFDLPSYTDYMMEGDRNASTLNIWTRPTIAWRLDCENDNRPRKEAFDNFSITLVRDDTLKATLIVLTSFSMGMIQFCCCIGFLSGFGCRILAGGDLDVMIKIALFYSICIRVYFIIMSVMSSI